MPPEIVKNGQFDRDAAADALRKFLEDTVRAGKLQLTVSVRVLGAPGGDIGSASASSREEEIIADLDGRDKEFLLERGAEALKALEHLAYRALRLEPAFHEKIHLDCGGYRALRFEELRMTARVAAGQDRTVLQLTPGQAKTVSLDGAAFGPQGQLVTTGAGLPLVVPAAAGSSSL